MISHEDEIEEGEALTWKLTDGYDPKPTMTLETLREGEVGHPGVNSQVQMSIYKKSPEFSRKTSAQVSHQLSIDFRKNSHSCMKSPQSARTKIIKPSQPWGNSQESIARALDFDITEDQNERVQLLGDVDSDDEVPVIRHMENPDMPDHEYRLNIPQTIETDHDTVLDLPESHLNFEPAPTVTSLR